MAVLFFINKELITHNKYEIDNLLRTGKGRKNDENSLYNLQSFFEKKNK